MKSFCNRQLYPYIFLFGNCLIWYGSSDIYDEIILLVILLPFLMFFNSTRPLAILIAGVLFAEYTAIDQQSWQFPQAVTGDNHLLIGKIEDLPHYNGNIVRFAFRVSHLNHQSITDNKTIKFRLSCYRNCPQFKPDQKWQLLVRLKPVNGYMNPGGFDYEKWLYSKQFKATGYILSSTQNKLISTDKGIDSLRFNIKKYFLQHLDDQKIVGSAVALTLGDKSLLQNQHQQILAKNGLSHLLAISGLHIGLSAIPGFLFAGFLWRKIRFVQKISRIQFQWFVCIIPALFYTALSGFGLPACRAMIMLLVFAFMQMVAGCGSAHLRFGQALWIILLLQPLAPLELSFWLSFCATAILIFQSKFSQSDSAVINLIRLQAQLFILLFPIQLFIFGSVSLISPLLNFVAIPFVSMILLPLLFLQVLASSLPLFITEPLFWLIEKLLEFFWDFLVLLQPYSDYFYYSDPKQTYWSLWLYPLFIMLLLRFQLRTKLIVVSMILLLQLDEKESDEFRMLVLDVGQGLSISIDYQDKALIYDTAYGSEDFRTAEMTLLPWLENLHISSIALMVVSHNDADHAGGMTSLMNNWPIKELLIGQDVIVPVETSYQPIITTSCHAGQNWQWHSLSIEVLSPLTANKSLHPGNDTSCVLLLTMAGKRILLSGDIESAAEKQLLQNYPDLSADILLVPHHGSKTSSTKDFIRQVNPDYAIFSSGFLNRFNHPDSSVSGRYKANGSKLLNTSTGGAIELTIDEQGKLAIKQWRLEKPALWRRY